MATATKAPKTATKKAPKAPKTATTGAFAVLATGGKQYLVREGQTLKIEKLSGEHKAGDSLSFDSVLLSGNASDITLGNPFVKGAAITATLKSIGRGKKVIVIKYKQKSRYFKKNGHRQPYYEITIDSIKRS